MPLYRLFFIVPVSLHRFPPAAKPLRPSSRACPLGTPLTTSVLSPNPQIPADSHSWSHGDGAKRPEDV